MAGDKPIRDRRHNGPSLADRGQLISKRLPPLALADPSHPDAEGFQEAPNMALKIFAKADQVFTHTNQGPKPVRIFTAHMDRREPFGTRWDN